MWRTFSPVQVNGNARPEVWSGVLYLYVSKPGVSTRQEQQSEFSESLVNRPRPVNRLVRTGTMSDFKPAGYRLTAVTSMLVMNSPTVVPEGSASAILR